MDAVIELAEFANEHVSKLDDTKAAITQVVMLRLPHATQEQHERAVELVMVAFKYIEEEAASEEFADGEPADAPTEDPEPSPWDTLLEDLEEVIPNSSAFVQYLIAYMTVHSRPRRAAVMNSSLLTTAVGNFEVLVSAVVREFLRLRPEAIRSDEARYSLAEIEGYESIEEFRAYCAERYAENLLRGGFEDWMEWFEKRLKIDLSDVTADSLTLREIFQRRHLVVHNGSRVNRLYLNKMSDLKPLPAMGTTLHVDQEYLQRATDRLQAAGVLLQAQVMRRLLPVEGDEHPADAMASNAIYEFLQHRRWEAAIEVAASIEPGVVSAYGRLLVLVNGWIARKRLHGVESIRSEVEAWQVQPLAPKFRLAKLALLDDVEAAYKLSRELVDSEEITNNEWWTWPLLEEVRAYHAAQAPAEDAQPGKKADGETARRDAPDGAPLT